MKTFVKRSPVLGALLLLSAGLAPGQAFAGAGDCAANLDLVTTNPRVEGEIITTTATIGKSDVLDPGLSEYMEIGYFAYCLDRQTGQNFSNCTSDGNIVNYVGYVGTTCQNSSDATTTFNIGQNGTYVTFEPSNGPMHFEPGEETCTIEFQFVVEDASPDFQILQAAGFGNPGEDPGNPIPAFFPADNTFCEATIPPDIVERTPVSASQSSALDIEPGVDPLQFTVIKEFTDDNPGPVEVWLSCNTGLPIEQHKTLYPGEENAVHFVMNDYTPGTLNCSVTEEPLEGYDADYTASLGEPPGLADSWDTGSDDDGCYGVGITGGTFICNIENDPEDVTIIVYKEWMDDNSDFYNKESVRITLHCDADIINGLEKPTGGSGDDDDSSSDVWSYTTWISPGDPGRFDVTPPWDGANCWVTEYERGDFFGDVSDCEDLYVEPGMGDECTVVNTRLYEGIPTLSQYGLAVLALLMLAIGAVGFRRYV